MNESSNQSMNQSNFYLFATRAGDICDASCVYGLLHEYKVDTIMHFAAQSHVDNSFGDSLSFTEANVLGTHVLLEAAKTLKKQIRRFIHVSTDEVYGEQSDKDPRCTEKSYYYLYY